MNNAPAILRTLIVYSICVPLAIWLGYLLTSLADFSRSTFIETGLFALALALPLFLRWHYVLLVLSINLSMTLFFLPGHPSVFMPMLAISLGISVLQRCLNKDMRFISAPQITKPLICLAAVVLVTAKLTGGIGLRSFGSDAMGGRGYIELFAGILAYFALTARRIPPQRAGIYIALFILPLCANVIGDLDIFLPSSFSFLYWFFAPNTYITSDSEINSGAMRFGGVALMSQAIISLMLARYGVRGIFLSGKPWRTVALALFFVLALFGGFRSIIITCAMIFLIVFFLEGMQRTTLLPLFLFIGLFAAVLAVPFANKLPYIFQRSLAFLPLNIDPAARYDAESSSNWRFEMFDAILPEVTSHLLLGKGYVLSQTDFQDISTSGFHALSADESNAALAGDYHNGFLSVVMPFGIWGLIAMVWFSIAGCHALYCNYRYGDPALRTINALLFAMFATHVFVFWSPIFGSLHSDMLPLAALLGLGVSMNGGICRPATEPVKPAAPAFSRRRLLAGFQR
jgi:hypothetical protein